MADSGDAIEEKAVQLIARKVAAVTGDLRKAISALEASIQLAISKNMNTLDIRTVCITLDCEKIQRSCTHRCKSTFNNWRRRHWEK